LQDRTAWVDFTGVAEAGLAAGAYVAGFTTQAQFLVNAGLDAVYAEQVAALEAALDAAPAPAGGASAEDRARNLSRQLAVLAQGAQRLVLPQEMGERFKVLALAKGYDAPLAGFARRDLTDTL